MDNEGRRYSAMGARAAPRYPHPLPPPEKGDILMLQNEGTFSRCVDSVGSEADRGCAPRRRGLALCATVLAEKPAVEPAPDGPQCGDMQAMAAGDAACRAMTPMQN